MHLAERAAAGARRYVGPEGVRAVLWEVGDACAERYAKGEVVVGFQRVRRCRWSRRVDGRDWGYGGSGDNRDRGDGATRLLGGDGDRSADWGAGGSGSVCWYDEAGEVWAEVVYLVGLLR